MIVEKPAHKPPATTTPAAQAPPQDWRFTPDGTFHPAPPPVEGEGSWRDLMIASDWLPCSDFGRGDGLGTFTLALWEHEQRHCWLAVLDTQTLSGTVLLESLPSLLIFLERFLPPVRTAMLLDDATEQYDRRRKAEAQEARRRANR